MDSQIFGTSSTVKLPPGRSDDQVIGSTHEDYLAEGRQGHAAARERFIHKASVIAKQESTALQALDSELNFGAAVASPIVPASPTGLVDSSRSIYGRLTDFLLQQAPVLEC